MIFDVLLYGALGALAVYAFLHFTGRLSAKTETDLSALERRIHIAMSQAGDEIVAKVAALPAAIEAKSAVTISDLQAQLDAEKTDHAADLTNIDGAVTAAGGA